MTDQDPNPSAGPRRGIPRIAVLTGAGISVDSGVPTLDEEVVRQLLGLDQLELAGVNAWEELASLSGWEAHPERVWAWYVWLHHMLTYIEPNDAHRAIAAWQEIAEVTVITQNLDDLHERAGSRRVLYLHGNIAEFRCGHCRSHYHGPLPALADPRLELAPPECACGGMIRPGVIWFGGKLPEQTWQMAVEAVRAAELLVVVGTSGTVYPAASLPELALAAGTRVVEVNPEPTPLTRLISETFREPASEALPELLHRLSFGV